LKIGFWEDKWFDNTTLREQYQALYNIVHHNNDTIAKVLKSSPANVTFTKDVVAPKLASWNILMHRLTSVKLTQGADELVNSVSTPCIEH
jgi:hypothetical protein